jgi:hypothetical protein
MFTDETIRAHLMAAIDALAIREWADTLPRNIAAAISYAGRGAKAFQDFVDRHPCDAGALRLRVLPVAVEALIARPLVCFNGQDFRVTPDEVLKIAGDIEMDIILA